MSSKFSKLPKTTFSGLEYQNIIEDIITLVKENPEYNQQYDDFLSSNAGRMLIELFAYITDQLATRIDFAVNENFLSTATKKSSVIKLLKLIGYSLKLPAAAKVNVTINAPVSDSDRYLSKGFDISDEETFLPFSLTAEDKNGVRKTFELLNIEDNSKINYNNPPLIKKGSETSNHIFYEGRTQIDNFYVETDNNQIFTLTSPSVIRNSVRVYKVTPGNPSLTKELIEVKSFLDPEAQSPIKVGDGSQSSLVSADANPIPYKINVEENNTVNIEFPSVGVINNPERRPSVNDHIRVFYRVGGGESGNIVPKSINLTKKIAFFDATGNIKEEEEYVNFINKTYGYEGEEEESTDSAILRAPAEIQTAKKTVTEDDYNTVLNSFDEVLLSKSIGNSNSIAYSSELYEKYGRYINPMEVWNFVLMNKEGWEDLDPDEYNDFNWFETRLENRFNEPVSFSNGENDKLYQLSEEELESGISRGEFTETVVGGTDTITNTLENKFDSSYIGNKVVIKNSTSVNKIGTTSIVVGIVAPNNILKIEPDFPETEVGDIYEIFHTPAFTLVTPNLFKENINSTNFKAKITKTPTSTFIFNDIENNLEIESENGFSSGTNTISENIFPFLMSNKNLKNGVNLNGNLIVNIDGETKTINFNNDFTTTTIIGAINDNFNYSDLTSNDKTFFIKGDTIKNNSEIHNINYNMSKLIVGMELEITPADGETPAVTNEIKEVYIRERYIVLDEVISSTQEQKEYKVIDNLAKDDHKVAHLDKTSDGEYIVLRSPTSGSEGFIYVYGELVNKIFGFSGAVFSKGVKKARIDDISKNIIYEYPSNSLYEKKNIYLQYLVSSDFSKVIGEYYSSDENSSDYREKADRIYSTQYDKIAKKIDYFHSDFLIKFTKEKVISSTLTAIEGDFNFSQNSFPQVKSAKKDFSLGSFTLKIKMNGKTINGNVVGQTAATLCDSINSKIQATIFDEPEMLSSFKYAVPDEDSIVLRNPTNFAESKIEALSGDDIFYDQLAENNSSTPSGDYYIKIVDDEIVMYKSKLDSLIDFPFYVHFTFDQRYVEGIYDGYESRKGKKPLELDEDYVNKKLTPYRITGVENTYKKPTFRTFDISGTIIYSNNFSRSYIERSVNSALKSNFNLESSEIGRSIYISQILSLIHSVDGVLSFSVSYFGTDKEAPNSNQQNMIEAGFDEIIVLGNNKNGKGINITYKSE